MRFAPVDLLKLVLAALLLVTITSIAVVVIAPDIGIYTTGEHAGRWRGTFGTKNKMGRMMSLAIILTIVVICIDQSKKAIFLCVGFLFTILLTMSGSATAVAATVLTLLVLPASRWLVRKQLPIFLLVPLALIGSILVILLVLSFAEPILTALGRDATLSGRTRLWELALAEGSMRPVLGTGFRTFWLENGPGSEVMARVSWGNNNIGNGHNAYLDIWLELGLLGFLAYGALLQVAAMRIAAMLSEGDLLGLPLAVSTVHISICGMTERVLLEHSDLSWLLLTALLLQATPALAPARQSALSYEQNAG
jgi:O-antigen ligase